MIDARKELWRLVRARATGDDERLNVQLDKLVALIEAGAACAGSLATYDGRREWEPGDMFTLAAYRKAEAAFEEKP